MRTKGMEVVRTLAYLAEYRYVGGKSGRRGLLYQVLRKDFERLQV
jgi:hypothetical protein